MKSFPSATRGAPAPLGISQLPPHARRGFGAPERLRLHCCPRRLVASLFHRSLVAGVVTVVVACGSPSLSGQLGLDQQVLRSCGGKPVAAFIAVDATGSSGSPAVVDRRVTAAQGEVRRAVICGGHLRVIAFGGTSAETSVVFDGAVSLPGATDIAKLRHVDSVVDPINTAVAKGIRASFASPPAGEGTDIVGQYRLTSEYAAQEAMSGRLEFLLLTDGFQNVGSITVPRGMTVLSARKLARSVSVPPLPGASVTVAGLGQVKDTPPSSSEVEGLIAFYNALCAKTKASTCLSVSDLETGR